MNNFTPPRLTTTTTCTLHVACRSVHRAVAGALPRCAEQDRKRTGPALRELRRRLLAIRRHAISARPRSVRLTSAVHRNRQASAAANGPRADTVDTTLVIVALILPQRQSRAFSLLTTFGRGARLRKQDQTEIFEPVRREVTSLCNQIRDNGYRCAEGTKSGRRARNSPTPSSVVPLSVLASVTFARTSIG